MYWPCRRTQACCRAHADLRDLALQQAWREVDGAVDKVGAVLQVKDIPRARVAHARHVVDKGQAARGNRRARAVAGHHCEAHGHTVTKAGARWRM